MGNIWTPNLLEIGIDPDELPPGWGWTTLSRGEVWMPGEPLTRLPQYGEFTVAPFVTDRHACNRNFEQAQLVVASTTGEVRRIDRLFLYDAEWRKSLIPWGAAPQWWLFGPQGEAFFAFVKQCRRDSALWGKISAHERSDTQYAAERLRRDLSHSQKLQVDRIMDDNRRLGAVARALHRATTEFYGPRISRFNQYRFPSSQGLPKSYGLSLNGVSNIWREQVGAMDNIIRWLILRDVLPAELYRLLAEPWRTRMGWPLHPNDVF